MLQGSMDKKSSPGEAASMLQYAYIRAVDPTGPRVDGGAVLGKRKMVGQKEAGVGWRRQWVRSLGCLGTSKKAN